MLYKYRKYFIALGLLLLCIVGVMMMNFFNKMAFGNVNIPRNSTKVNTQNTSNKSNSSITNSLNNDTSITYENPQSTNTQSSKNNQKKESSSGSNSSNNGESLGSANTVPYATKSIIKDDNCNINYDKELTIKSKNKELIYKIINAKMLSNNEFAFGVKIIKNDGIGSLNVIALDNCGNSLIVTPSNQSAGDVIDYVATLENPNTKCLEISVQNEFDVNDQQTTQVTINFAKKETIDSLYITNNKSTDSSNKNVKEQNKNNDKKSIDNSKKQGDK